MRFAISCMFALATLFSTISANAAPAPQTVTTLDEAQASAATGEAKFEYILTEQKLQPEALVDDRDLPWRPLTFSTFGLSQRTLWARGVIEPQTEASVLHVANPLLDHLEIWIFHGEAVEHYELGTFRPFGERPHDAEADYVVSLPPAQVPSTIVVSVRSNSSLRVPISIRSHSDHVAGVQLQGTIRGLYYGLIIALLIYSLVLGPAFGDRSYLLFSICCASILLLVFTIDGTGFQFLWPNSPWWQAHVLTIAASLMIATHGLFAMEFLRVHNAGLRQRLHSGVVFLAFAAAALGFFVTHQWLLSFVAGLSLLYAPILMFEGFVRMRERSVAGRYFVMAIAAVIVGLIFFSFRESGLIRHSALIDHALQIGVAADVLFLALALTARFAYERSERERATANAQALNIRLEEIQKTRELELREQDLQQSLRHAQQLRLLGQMASGFAHGFNNILTSIIGFTELAMQRASEQSDEKLRRTLTEIHTSGHRAAELVDQLLTYAGGTQTSVARMDATVVVDRAVAIARPLTSTRLRVEWMRPTQPIMAMIDVDQAQQAIVNLCLYMRDMSTTNGAILIDVEANRDVQAICTSCQSPFKGRYQVIRARDAQSHVETDLSSIFTPFHTSRPGEAPSLSLAVVHGIVHEHSGHILVEAMSPAGLDFRLCFPVEPEFST